MCAAGTLGCLGTATSTPLPVTNPTSSSSNADTTKDSSVAESKSAPAASTKIDLVETDWAGLQSLIAEHKGKVVVVDVWSTACEPCMKEFPNLVALKKKYPDQVTAISFDIDFAGIPKKPVSFYRERVLEFLQKQGESAVIHRMCTTAADDLFGEIKLDSIPAVYVYGKDGGLAKRFDGSSGGGEVSYETQVNPFVDDLVK